jgi:hypothetical protein
VGSGGYGCELDAGRGEWSDFRPVGGWFVGGGQVSHFWVVAFPEAAVGGRFVKAAVGTSRLDFIHVAPRFLISGYRIQYCMMGGGMQGFFYFSSATTLRQASCNFLRFSLFRWASEDFTNPR